MGANKVKYCVPACHRGAANPGLELVFSRSAQETAGLTGWYWFVQMLTASGSLAGSVPSLAASGSVKPVATTRMASPVGHVTLGLVIEEPQFAGSAPAGMSLMP